MARAQAKKNPQQLIMLAASRAQRRIHIMYVLLALIFAAALGYLLVRVGISLFEAPAPVELETRPVEVPQRAEAPPRSGDGGRGERALLGHADISRLDEARSSGFRVLGAHDVRTEEQLQRDAAGTEALDEEAAQRFRELVEQAERLLERRYDYPAAVRRFEAALALTGVPYYERELAVEGRDRAQVFHTVVSGVTPLEQRYRVVRYLAPGEESDAAIVGLVSRDVRNWHGAGSVRMKRLDTNTLTEFRVSPRWDVEELVGEALQQAKAERVHHHMNRLHRLRGEGLLNPVDLIEVAVLIRETGDFRVPGGDSIDAEELAHACLSEAYDLCLDTGTSLTETVLLRRDQLFTDFAQLQSTLLSVTQDLAAARGAQRRELEERHADVQRRSHALLSTLVRRYPRAWDFRHLEGIADAEVLYERFINQANEEAEREADVIAGEGERASDAPEGASREERIAFYVTRGERHMERAYELVHEARSGELPADEVQETYAAAVDRYFRARDYFRQAHQLAPDDEEIARKLRTANQEIGWTRREMSLRR